MKDQEMAVASKTNINAVKDVKPADDITQPTVELSNFFIIKNLVFISLAFVINFTATNGLGILQSSINSDQGLGTASLSVVYAGMIISCMFSPTYIIKKIGCKWTMAISILGYSSYIAANFKPSWGTMIPTALLEGFAAGPLWSAKCVYITYIAKVYAVRNNMSVEAITNIFFGIFFTMFQSAQIWGNLLSTKLLQPSGNSSVHTYSTNRLDVCGSNYCNEDLDALDHYSSLSLNSNGNSTSDIKKSNEVFTFRTDLYTGWGRMMGDNKIAVKKVFSISQIYCHHIKISDELRLLIGIYLGMTLFTALFIVICVNQLPKSKSIQGQPTVSGMRLVVATFAQLQHIPQLLLIPLTIFRGMEESFGSADLTQAFVTCPLGVQYVGLVAVCAGVVGSVFALIYGFSIKLVGRLPVFLFAAAVSYTAIAVMLNVPPSPDKPVVIYVMSGLGALGDACWQSQISALYGVLFYDNMEAAFSSFRLFDSIGFILGFSWHTFICIRAKLWIMLGLLSAGMIGYLAVEFIAFINTRKCIPIRKFKPPTEDVNLVAYKSTNLLCKGSEVFDSYL